MLKHSEAFIEGYGGCRLFLQSWEAEAPKAIVLITHGQAEHGGSYHRLIDFFRDDRYGFFAGDLRGHGRSEGKRGHASDFDEYLRDFESFLRPAREEAARRNVPLILLAHSMGGLVQLKALVRGTDTGAAAQVLSSPLLGFPPKKLKLKRTVSRILDVIAPSFTFYNTIRPADLTDDAAVLTGYKNDPLRHDRISGPVYLGMLASIRYVQDNADKVRLPTLLLTAEKDEVVSAPDTLKFMSGVKAEKEIKIYPHGTHEMFNGTQREAVFGDLKKYLDGQVNRFHVPSVS